MLLGFLLFVVVAGGPNAIAFVVAIVAALVIHEGGHYLAGRWSGMLVTEYFIGVGPRIFSFRRGETVYGVKAIPLGAYVRIVGMNNLETVDPAFEARTYRQAAWHKRVITILAGPATHFVIALILMAVYLAGQGRPIADEQAWAVGDVVENTVAEQAGVQPGDRILSVGGVESTIWEDLSEVVSGFAGQETELSILRGEEELTLDIRVGDRLNQTGAAGLNGLYDGDIIRSYEGQPVANYAEFAELARQDIGETVTVEVQLSGDEIIDQRVDINAVLANDADAVNGFLGVTRGTAFETLSFGEAITSSPTEVGVIISDIAERTPRLVSSRDGLRSLFGLTAFDDPVAADPTIDPNGQVIETRPPTGTNIDENRPISLLGLTVIASALQNGWFVLFLVIVMNLFFGLFNLLPLLPLDGGHIALASYEKVRSIFAGKSYAADAAKMLPVTYAVFGLMMVVSLIAFVRDVFDFVL